MSKSVKRITGIPKRVRPLFSATDSLEQAFACSAQTVKQGQFLIMEGEALTSVFCLLSGWLALSKCLPEGEAQVIDFALPGEIIKAGGADQAVSAVSVEALTDASLVRIPISTWQRITQQRPELSRMSKNIQAAARARIWGRMLRLGRGDAAMRLAYVLLELNFRLEAAGLSQNGKFRIPVNQRVLGDFVGLSSVHVCRTLGQFVRNGMIHLGGHMNIEILDIDGLAQIAGVDLQLLPHELLVQADHGPSMLYHAACA